MDAAGNEVVLFGIDADYPMQDGEACTGLVAAVPLEYISDFLFSENQDALIYCHIIRPDGSLVIANSNTELVGYFSALPASSAAGGPLEGLDAALEEQKDYTVTLDTGGNSLQIYGKPLPHSEWYLISVMPYGMLDESINDPERAAHLHHFACLRLHPAFPDADLSAVLFPDPPAAAGAGKGPPGGA